MSGTKAGSLKAKQTNLKKDPNFYKKIGSQSWKNPERSHKTGFALLPKEERAELGRKGGKKTKSEYKEEWTTAEEIAAIAEAYKDDSEPL